MATVAAGTNRVKRNHSAKERKKRGCSRIERKTLRAKKGETAGAVALPSKSHSFASSSRFIFSGNLTYQPDESCASRTANRPRFRLPPGSLRADESGWDDAFYGGL